MSWFRSFKNVTNIASNISTQYFIIPPHETASVVHYLTTLVCYPTASVGFWKTDFHCCCAGDERGSRQDAPGSQPNIPAGATQLSEEERSEQQAGQVSAGADWGWKHLQDAPRGLCLDPEGLWQQADRDFAGRATDRGLHHRHGEPGRWESMWSFL